jgi:hypothetical protein
MPLDGVDRKASLGVCGVSGTFGSGPWAGRRSCVGVTDCAVEEVLRLSTRRSANGAGSASRVRNDRGAAKIGRACAVPFRDAMSRRQDGLE